MTAMKPSLKALKAWLQLPNPRLWNPRLSHPALPNQMFEAGLALVSALEAGELASACSTAPGPPRVRREDRPAPNSEQRLLLPEKRCRAAIWGRETSSAPIIQPAEKPKNAGRERRKNLAFGVPRTAETQLAAPCPQGAETRRTKATSLHQTFPSSRLAADLVEEFLQLPRQRDGKR